MTNRRKYIFLDHAADLALRVWGDDLPELVGNAAEGLLEALYAEPPPSPTGETHIEVSAESPEEVVQHALRALLYLLEDDDLAPVLVSAAPGDGEDGVRLMVGVAALSAVRGLLSREIKAVTRHGLAVREIDGRLQTDIIFDI